MSVTVDVHGVSDINNQDENIYERLKNAAQHGGIERLYKLIAEDPKVFRHFDLVPFCETPLHVAAEKGQTHFAMELMTLKPSLALKLNTSGFSPMHLALQSNHTRTVRGFITFDSSLVNINGKGRITPLHHVAGSGHTELLSEFLFACPSSVEGLTIKCETAMHVAVKNRQVEALKVLLGWLKRANREDILDWKDEDGNTVYHIAAAMNQTEVIKLLGKIVKVTAKNLDGKTAMDILQTQKSACFGERLRFGSTMTLAGYLSKKPSYIEKWSSYLGRTSLSKTRHGSVNTSDDRSTILVVAILIATASYEACLSPPGGLWDNNVDDHRAGEMVMPLSYATAFHVFNLTAFFLSIYVILILTVGLPMWRILCSSIAALGVANWISFTFTYPAAYSKAEWVSALVVVCGYVVTTGIIVCIPIVGLFLNKHRRRQVDFPARYFTSPREV